MAKRVTTRRAAVPAWLREQGTALMGQIRARLDVEGRKALRQMEAGMADLQERLRREKAVVGRRVDEGVKGALARLNIPPSGPCSVMLHVRGPSPAASPKRAASSATSAGAEPWWA